jgi:hypothetical protein
MRIRFGCALDSRIYGIYDNYTLDSQAPDTAVFGPYNSHTSASEYEVICYMYGRVMVVLFLCTIP